MSTLNDSQRALEFLEAFHEVPTITVGLTCDYETLTSRERRTGRWGGIAADSGSAHDGWIYDFKFDTTNEPDPLAMARLILRKL